MWNWLFPLRRRVRELEAQLREREQEVLREQREQELLREQREQLLREREQEREQERRERQQLMQETELTNGTFYSTVDQVWGVKAESFGFDNFNALRRMVPPPFFHQIDRAPTESSGALSFTSGTQVSRGTENSANARATYTWIVECARKPLFGVAVDASAHSHKSNTKLDIWPVDIFGNDPVPTTEIAHLIPAGRKLSELYVDVAICTLALKDDDGWEVFQKAIHGCTDPCSKKRKREASLVGAPIEMRGPEIECTGDEGETGNARRVNCTDSGGAEESNTRLAVENEASGRVTETAKKEQDHTDATGIVAEEANTQLALESTAADRVPEKGTVDEIKAFSNPDAAGVVVQVQDSQTKTLPRIRHTGIKHSVCNMIRLAGQAAYFDRNAGVLIVPAMDLEKMKRWDGEGYKAIVMVKGLGGAVDPGEICRTIRMIKATPGAEFADIEKARMLLSEVVKGLAHSLFHRFHGESAIEHELDERQQGQLSDLRRNFANPFGGGVIVPVPKTRDPGQAPPRVRIVTFGSASVASFDDDGKKLHPAPDPLLLAVRAAVNWSAQNNQKLLAAAEPLDLSDSEDDYLDRMAEEDYLEWRDAARRNPSWEELGRRLGQPHGYKGDDGASTASSKLSDRFDEDLDRLSEGQGTSGHGEEYWERPGEGEERRTPVDGDTTTGGEDRLAAEPVAIAHPAVPPETAPAHETAPRMETGPARGTEPPEAAPSHSTTGSSLRRYRD